MIDPEAQAEAGSAAGLHYDRNLCLHEMLRMQARATPEATALVFGDTRLSYRDLDRVSDALALHLVRIGVHRADIIGLFLPRSANAIICKIAILKAGGAYLPLDPALPVDHLDFVIGECLPKVIFVDSAFGDKLCNVPSMNAKVIEANAIIAEMASQPRVAPPATAITGADLAYIMYTSGSTGRPKGTMICHRSIARVALDQNYADFRRDDVILHAATISFDASTFEIWGALLNGCTMAIMPDGDFSISRLSDFMRATDVSISFLTTGLFNLFADHVRTPLPKLRHVLFGGEVGSVVHARRFLEHHPGCKLTNIYGPTETTVFATAFPVLPSFSGGELPIGKAIAHTGVAILDEELRIVPPGIEGQLAISGDGLAIAYFKRPELTEQKFVTIATKDGAARFYLTGDMASMKPDGTVTFKGRRDRQVKINGKRIELDEIETALRRDPRLADGIVLCHVQGENLKRIVAYLCPKESHVGAGADLVQGVMATLRMALPAYMIPSAAVIVDTLPLTAAGKVDRSKLLPPPVEMQTKPMDTRSRTEELLTTLWQDALSLAGVDVDRNFFDLGGTSLQLMEIHAGLEEALGRPIDVVALLRHPTIRELALYLDGRTAGPTRIAAAAQRAALQKKAISHMRRSSL
ncbi:MULTISPECIES: non-ribosomal peptide synthetase [unclassified Rhizobium]|uniref:non-ribosomal peptide synthetase n=1 Tax=unclassified Rhizobium TaxID=2613769 RepID=UPI00161A73D7|nr:MULTISPECIES: non-ribosomal peptide synthetase [unclassified Rhizobium]MBB3287029.1 amino acid adenylation domain-containing protein [Rhizobium sp. BK252]MBB3401769.1 amino acid adenylation domain-containing protein [Rhizobium sp. BK289]MBB3414287.1 amino acid adenylation domain-containing protein [Rhizobium sp. BK284]MBB3482174.1 amino acid adenylation domain-containing protein [Rhizobium sp. BK347]